jgi:hypothetical protein
MSVHAVLPINKTFSSGVMSVHAVLSINKTLFLQEYCLYTLYDRITKLIFSSGVLSTSVFLYLNEYVNRQVHPTNRYM